MYEELPHHVRTGVSGLGLFVSDAVCRDQIIEVKGENYLVPFLIPVESATRILVLPTN